MVCEFGVNCGSEMEMVVYCDLVFPKKGIKDMGVRLSLYFFYEI
jgi:hypothetical protein